MTLQQETVKYLEQHREEAFALLLELAKIPAPSNHEEKRAEFCRRWLEQQGAEGVYIDDALNVVYPVGCTENTPLTVFMAHSDVVFPDTEELPLEVRDGRVYCPGVGDDTANAAALLMTAKYIAENGLQPKNGGVLLVINSGEEGLGNLKGCRRVMETFGSRITEFVSFDAHNGRITHRAVGSRRYRITVTTEGGHSWGSFGNRNAIAYLASMIRDLYAAELPAEGKTTYNVGTIRGGTSVNTIAQDAEMLYEIRSDCRDSLTVMEQYLETVVEAYRAKGIGVEVELVGERPCMGDVDPVRHRRLIDRAAEAVRTHFGMEPTFHSGSTDCNIPLSVGIPAIAVGCYNGGGTHTREEYLEIDSLFPGLKLAFDMVLEHFA